MCARILRRYVFRRRKLFVRCNNNEKIKLHFIASGQLPPNADGGNVYAMLIQVPIIALAAAIVGLGFTGLTHAQAPDPIAPDAVVAYGGPDPLIIETEEGAHSFTVELANTPEARERGMMFRESMDPDTGMLFDYEQPQLASIWMRNTLIPLDIVFIRDSGAIAKIVTNARPLSLRSMGSDVPVLAVLELAGGRTLELGIDPGDIVRHPLFGNWKAVEAVTPPQEDMQDSDASDPG